MNPDGKMTITTVFKRKFIPTSSRIVSSGIVCTPNTLTRLNPLDDGTGTEAK